MDVVSQENGEKADCERQLSMWLHKSQIELSAYKKSAGNINAAAFLPSTRVTAPKREEEKQEVVQVSQGTKAIENSASLDIKYDWFQSLTHVFVSYRIKKGGDELKNGDLKVSYGENSVQLETQSKGEILIHLDFANEIIPDQSSFTCSTKKVELKLKKKIDNINWIVLE